MKALTPKEIVNELDRFVIGQDKAKRSVAIALRNRWRRRQADENIRNEIMPNNIIMIGPTGVGKTEIARRLAALAQSPFIKVEATKFTEVGYVGRDVESIIRDLTYMAVDMVEKEHEELVRQRAEELADARIVDLLFPVEDTGKTDPEERERISKTRDRLKVMYAEGKFDDRYVEIESAVRKPGIAGISILGPMDDAMGGDMMENPGEFLNEAMSSLLGGKKSKKRKVKVPEARNILIDEESQKLVDRNKVIEEAIDRVQQHGIVFIDEIDKIAMSSDTRGADVSRQGVQRDLLPIVEGSTVKTRYGFIKTDHILFIASGAFHSSKPSDLIPELQGRFPIRVELDSLSTDDFVKILSHPQNALIKQYQALMKSEGVELVFENAAIREIAVKATEVNDKTENIGARRLHTIMTQILDDIMFNAPNGDKKIVISAKQVRDSLDAIVTDDDLSRYIL
ncbi:MAG: ATP-dependent protease ATPase subunit HslU [Candidatus Neomarinimicrobiota bacterium]|jgi:ATP-dependent HslUV protease ATP-binding subunit HslU|nr:ATP-dependent protease ATPase subunit HslU [Candidatus Neomarinimicrobiota bacterium]MDD3965488.1 ATP-dependent protease ATPase subunit HslU [Candidatus Neomarinimicrobiota bacterium]